MGARMTAEEQLTQQHRALKHVQRLLVREIAAAQMAADTARIHAANAIHEGRQRAAMSYAKEVVASEREWESLRQLRQYINQFQASMVRQRTQLGVNKALEETTKALRHASVRMPTALFAQVIQTYHLETEQLGFRQDLVQETLDATAPDADADADDATGVGADEDVNEAARSLFDQLVDEHELRVHDARLTNPGNGRGASRAAGGASRGGLSQHN
jgi:hypothetical protein